MYKKQINPHLNGNPLFFYPGAGIKSYLAGTKSYFPC